MAMAIKLVNYCVPMIGCLNQFEHSHANKCLAFLRAAPNLLKEEHIQQKHWVEDKNNGETIPWGYYNGALQFFEEWSN
jgi:hypothetical protein